MLSVHSLSSILIQPRGLSVQQCLVCSLCWKVLVAQLVCWCQQRSGSVGWLMLADVCPCGSGCFTTTGVCDLPLMGCCSHCFVCFSCPEALRQYALKIQIPHYTVDHLAQGSMKNGANSEMPCELQDHSGILGFITLLLIENENIFVL